MWTVKNSIKRRPARGPRAAINAGTGELVWVSRMAEKFPGLGFIDSVIAKL